MIPKLNVSAATLPYLPSFFQVGRYKFRVQTASDTRGEKIILDLLITPCLGKDKYSVLSWLGTRYKVIKQIDTKDATSLTVEFDGKYFKYLV